jgi:hypothetical protein
VAAAWLEKEAKAGRKFSAEGLLAFLRDKVAPFCSGWLQDTVPDQEAIPQPWRDEVTGQTILNPFQTDDLAGQAILNETAPSLAKHLKRLAADGGYTVTYAKELADEKAKRERLASIKYGPDQRRENPFLTDDLRAQSEFVRNNDAEIVARFRAEARPFTCAWSPQAFDLSALGRIAKADREAGDIVQRAKKIEEAWRKSDLEEARRAEEEAAGKRRAAEAMLQAK